MKKFKLILAVLFLVIPFLAKADITINVNSPKANGVANDNLSISVTILSTYSMDTVRATVAGRSVLLTVDPSSSTLFVGTLVLTGLPQGQQQLNIYAKDALGNTQTANSNFIFDSLPTVTVQAPTNYTSYQNKLHIKALVQDLGHTNCKGMVTITNQNFSISFVNTIDTLVDPLPGVSAGAFDLNIIAIDSLSQTNSVTLSIVFDKSPYLQQVFADTGQILDFQDNRVLLQTKAANGAPVLRIKNVNDGSSELIQLGRRANSGTTVQAKLCSTGAVLLMDSLFVWSGGKLNRLIYPRGLNSFEFNISKDYLMFYADNSPNGLYLTNLHDLSTTRIANNVVNNQNSISSDNIVAYSASNNIFTYDISTNATKQITNAAINIYPTIDGKNIFYLKKPTSSGSYYNFLNDGVRDYNLGVIGDNNASIAQLSDGYAAYNGLDKNGIYQVWLRRPDTTIKQLTFFSTTSQPYRLGNNGSILIYQRNNSLYYTDSLTALKPVSGAYGSAYFVNGNFYLVMGNGLYKYINLTTSIAPVITAFTPASAGAGTKVTIKGTHFAVAKAVSFGGVNAASFTAVSDTTIIAVVGPGASGDVSVIGYSSDTAKKSGFIFIPAPTITSFSPIGAGTGQTITIKGTNFTGATTVGFGGTPAASFTVVSDTLIQAALGVGKSGNVAVTTPGGTGDKTGFIFVPTPSITFTGSAPTFLTGGSLVLTASTGDGFNYAWALDGTTIAGATGYTYTATKGGSYTVSLVAGIATTTSAALQVTEEFVLPPDDISITVNDETCRGSKNGSIAIAASTAMNYTAEVTGNGIDSVYHFTATAKSQNLAAGTYNVCITVDGQSGFKQCYTSVINEPADLSVYSSVDEPNRTVTLTLSGGDLYNIELNGAQYTTSQSSLTLSLLQGDNTLSITTDKSCQGGIVKHISIGNDIILFPNPVDNILNITLGKSTAKTALVEVRDLNGTLVYSGEFANQYGSIQVDLSTVTSGIHVLKLDLDNSESIFKIIKK